MATRRRAAVLYTVLVVGLAAAGGIALKAVWDAGSSSSGYPHCTIGSYELDTDQASVAAAMVGAVTSHSPPLPDRAAVAALAAGLQESKLRNLPPGAGDRDSVGVLQQRPSQGWGGGDPKALQDVSSATKEFLTRLVKIDGWQTMPLAEAVQRVQISADGSAYAQHEPEATALARGLLGRTPEGVTCTFDKPTVVAATATVKAQLLHELPVNAPRVTASTLAVPGAHWQTAAWFVANADRYGIDSVAYDGNRWTRAKGWQRDAAAPATEVRATMAVVRKKS